MKQHLHLHLHLQLQYSIDSLGRWATMGALSLSWKGFQFNGPPHKIQLYSCCMKGEKNFH